MAEQQVKMHYWYIDDFEFNGQKFKSLHGHISGHASIPDTTFANTSEVLDVSLNMPAEEVIVETRNSTYHCPFAYCKTAKQDNYPDYVPDYSMIKNMFAGQKIYPEIEPGNVLLVFSDFDEFYFHSMFCAPDIANGPLEYSAGPHISVDQDSYLVRTMDKEVDVRFYPHYKNVEFYKEESSGMPIYLENIGDCTFYAKTSVGVIELKAGERKGISAENVMKEQINLPGGDLYSATIC